MKLFWAALLAALAAWGQTPPLYKNADAPLDKRVDDLLSRLTVAEKVSQMMNDSPAIERLGIPAYNWWSECLHGVARAGRATVFPEPIGLAATWDPGLIFRMATAISDEARAKNNEFQRRGKRSMYQGLTFWSPNINLVRDPRWGRGMALFILLQDGRRARPGCRARTRASAPLSRIRQAKTLRNRAARRFVLSDSRRSRNRGQRRSEEHTSELQSLRHLVCRLL